MEATRGELEELVARALDTLPPPLVALMDNVVVLVEDDAPAHDPRLLGLYDGVPLTERGGDYTFREPDRIFVYRRPLLEMCTSAEELVEEVRITVVHEVAHHFGIDDDRLHDLGYA